MCAFDVSCLTQHQALVSAIIWLGAIIKVSNKWYFLMLNAGIAVYQHSGLFLVLFSDVLVVFL